MSDPQRTATPVTDPSIVASGVQLADLEARVRRLEAARWPAPPIPTVATEPNIKDWSAYDGVVPAGQLLKDTDGKIYRNVTTVPLTTPPSEMPGGPTPWAHLWALVVIRGGGGATPAVLPWSSAGVSYKVGDKVTYGAPPATYECLKAHTSQVGWTPPAVASLWKLSTS